MRRVVILLLAAGALLAFLSLRGVPDAPEAELAPVQAQDHALSAGEYYVVALDRQGRIFGWGGLESLRVSPGTRLLSESRRPRLLVAGAGYRQVAAGHRALYALDAHGGLWRAGLDDVAGAGAVATPLPVSPERTWKRAFERRGVGVGIQADGSLWHWQDETLANQVEQATTLHLREPHRLMHGARFVDACLQGSRLHAVDDAGHLWRSGNLAPRGWGDDGRPLQGERPELQRMSADGHLRRVFCRENAGQVFALDDAGHLHGYGRNMFGELGMGEPELRGDPAAMDALVLRQVSGQAWASVAVNPTMTLAIARDGSLWGWGRNSRDELGIGDSEQRPTPALIDSSRRWSAVAATYAGGVAMTTSGELLAWGHNQYGLLGEGGIAASHPRPAPVLTDERFGAGDENG